MERGWERGGGRRGPQQHSSAPYNHHQQHQAAWYPDGSCMYPYDASGYYCAPVFYPGYPPAWPVGYSGMAAQPMQQAPSHQGFYPQAAFVPTPVDYNGAWGAQYGYVPCFVPMPAAPAGQAHSAEETVHPPGSSREHEEVDVDEAASDCASEDMETFTPNYRIPLDLNPHGWGSLTVGILQSIISRVPDSDLKAIRLTCKHWRAVMDQNLEQLTPSSMKSKLIVTRFPNLKVLHLTGCENVRNRDLLLISRSGLRLHTLTLGDDSNKPWVTNRGLACIAKITTLTTLNLQDCNSVTNKGLQVLNSLKCLTTLSLRGCVKLTNQGLEALQRNTALTSLNLSGCSRISDKGLLPLTQLPHLLSLHLGHTRVKDEGLSYINQITTLRELHLAKEDVSDAGIRSLSSLTNLQSLAIRECRIISGEGLTFLIPKLPHLASLDLYRTWDFDDRTLDRCLEFLSGVTLLDLRGTYVTERGIKQLARLQNLQKLCLAPPPLLSNHDARLAHVSHLTQLTGLAINTSNLVSFGMLESLKPLKQLRELDISNGATSSKALASAHKVPEPVKEGAIEAMANITSLTSLDLSRRGVQEGHLIVLAERLPLLRTLVVIGCPVPEDEVQSLQRRFPELYIHRKPHHEPPTSCASSDHGGGSS